MTGPRTYHLLIRPVKPEWFHNEDLDSLPRIVRASFAAPVEYIGYLQGWIDCGYAIMNMEREK